MAFVKLKNGDIRQVIESYKDGSLIVKTPLGETETITPDKVEKWLTKVLEILRALLMFIQIIKK